MGIFSSKNARELAKQLKASSDEEIMIPWRQLNDRQMAQESLLKTPDRNRLLSGATHQRPEYRGGLSLGGVAIADSAQRPYNGKIGGPGGDYAKIGGQSRDRMFDARMRPMLTSEQRDRIVTPHKPPTSSASSSASSDVTADKGYANNGGLSSLDIQTRVHAQSSYGYHPAKVYGVMSTADRDVRPVVKPTLALTSTGSTVAPSSNLPVDWMRGSHLGHVTTAGHASLSAGPPRAVSQQHEYSPPLDLSVKAASGSASGSVSGSGMVATKRRLTQEVVATAHDEPLDLSVKRPRKEAADESDDDVIVVGVHNAPSSADRVRPGVAQLVGTPNHLRMLQPAPASVGPHLTPSRTFGYPAAAPPTGGMVHKQQQQQQQPPQQLVVGDLSHYQSPRPAVPLACCLPAGQSRHASPLPPAQSRHASPLPPGQSRHASPLLRQTSPMNQAQRRSVSPMSPSLSPSTRSRLPSPLSSPHMRQATRDLRQGVPLVWSFEHGKLKPDAKHISNTHSSSSPSCVVTGPAKPPRDSMEYQRVIRDPERGLESRVGPPETYQGPCGQERHIQRIDKHQELVLGYEKPIVPAITKQQPMGLSSGSPWIGSSGTGISVGAEGYMGQKSPSCQASTSPLSKTIKTPPDVLIQKDGDRPETKERPPVYLDHPGAAVQFGSKPMPYSRPVSGLSTSQPEVGQNGHAVPVPRTPGVTNKPAVQQAYGMTVSDIPKFKVTMQGNKLYQQRTPDRPYPDQLSSVPAPSTVEEPVRLSQQNGCPVISVPIIKEENKVFPQSHPGPYGAKLAVPTDDVSKPLKVDQKPVGGGGSTSGAPARGSDDAVTVTGPGHAQNLTGTNMISKTESMFVNGPHKMIPVANVHPIRKLTSSIGAGAGKPDDSDLFHGESPEAKKADVKEETKKPDIPVPDVHQKIQKAPHPLYRSHQDEFVRFLSRSGASSPNTSRPGKKQLKLLGKSCADKIRNKLCAGPENADDLRSDLELVRRDLALHFSTPKGRHKLLAAKNSPAFVQEFVASLAGSGLDALRDQPGQVTDAPSSQSQDESADTSQPAVKTEPEEERECQRKKTKGSGTKRRKPAGRNGDTAACRAEQPSDRVPCKKRKRRKIAEDDPDELFDDEDDDDEVYVLPLDDVDSSDAREDNGTPRRRHLTDKRARREEQRSNRGEKRPYRRKTQRMLTRPEGGADSPRSRRKERGRSRSSRIRAALRKSRRATLYDKNAAYEAELRKEEERRLLRRVRREERCQVVITSSDTADDVQLATGENTADGGELQDASCDDGQAEEARRALRSTKQLGRSMRRSRQLSLKGRVSSQKGHLLRDPRFPAEAIVELHPLRMRNKVKARRLPSEKVNKRKKEGRSCTRPLSETPDKKRLFVCRETGETTLHKAARKGYVDAALQYLDSELVDINVRDNAGYTPLHESCVSGSLAIARALIARGADANVKALDGTRPLHDAVDNNHLELVRLLLSQGADPTIANYGGRTPLKLARSPMMKTFMSDYLADLRDDGPDWEVPPYTGRRGDELGFDIVADAPDAEGFDPGQDVFFDICSDMPLPMFYLSVDKNTGPRNYHLVRDVSRRLDQDNQDDFMLLNGDLHFVEVSKSTVVEQLRANPLCAADIRQLDDVGDSVQLVEVDSTLCQLLEVSREPLRAESGDSRTTSEPSAEPSDPDPDEKTSQANPEEGPNLPDTASSPAATSPPKAGVRDKKRPSNMRKSKSCTSLDTCDVNKMTINQLTALNRSESSPNVQNAPALKSNNNNNNRNNNNNNANNTNGCCTFGFNPYAKDKKLAAKKRTELFGSPAKTKLGRHLDRAVLCNEMTALAREVTRTVLAREVNKKVRLSKRFAGSGMSSTSSPCVLVASSSSASYSSGQSPVTFTPKSAKVTDQQKRNYVISGELNSVTNSCRAANSCDRSQLAHRVDGTVEPVNGVLKVTDNPDGADVPDCGDVCGVMVVVAGDGGRIEHAISAGDGADPDDGGSPDRERSRLAERPAPDAARCPTGPSGATSAHDGATVVTANNTTVATATTSSTTTSSELALPVLENPFEEEAKQVPSVTNEGSNLEDREMPELTLCTY